MIRMVDIHSKINMLHEHMILIDSNQRKDSRSTIDDLIKMIIQNLVLFADEFLAHFEIPIPSMRCSAYLDWAQIYNKHLNSQGAVKTLHNIISKGLR